MKVVFLLAGVGERLGMLTKDTPKALFLISDKCLLGHLLDRFILNGLSDFIFVVGHQADKIKDFIRENYDQRIKARFILNPKYKEANNMYSMWCARDDLSGKEFIVCNGDMVLNRFIIGPLLNHNIRSAVVVDDLRKEEEIDSPKVVIEEGRVIDLGRHVPRNRSFGYAVGLYKFDQGLSKDYFKEIEKMIQDKKMSANYQEPLLGLFSKHKVVTVSTKGLCWADLDLPEDIVLIEKTLKKITEEEKGNERV